MRTDFETSTRPLRATPGYAEAIREAVPDPGIHPAMVEGYMRLEFGTLDHLAPRRFAAEARDAAIDVRADLRMAEINARTFGLEEP